MQQLTAKAIEMAHEISRLDEIKHAAQGSAFPVTRNDYAHYASVISAITSGVSEANSAAMKCLTAEALILAGANRQGVVDAVRMFFGIDWQPTS